MNEIDEETVKMAVEYTSGIAIQQFLDTCAANPDFRKRVFDRSTSDAEFVAHAHLMGFISGVLNVLSTIEDKKTAELCFGKLKRK